MVVVAPERCIPVSYLPLVHEGSWRRSLSEELVSLDARIQRNYSPAAAASGDYSVYTGAAGVAFMYWSLATAEDGAVPMQKADLLAKAKAYIDVAVRSGGKPKRSSSKASTFLTGLAGVYAIAAAIHTTCNEPSQAAVWCQEVISLAPTAVQEGIPSELLYGRVGYLSALLFLAANAGLKLSEHSEILGRIVQLILEDGKWLGQAEGWPLMWEWHGKKYLGAAHGLCGILTVLLHLREVVRQFDGCDDLVRRAIDQLMSMRYSSGNLPSSIGSQQDALVHWCHGATGFVPLMCAAYKAYQDSKYLDAARFAADVVMNNGILRKGFGICHGISGSGLSLLCMHRTDTSGGFDVAALRMALFVCKPLARDDETAQALKEALLNQPDRPDSLMEGQAGIGCLFAALLQGTLTPEAFRRSGASAPWLM